MQVLIFTRKSTDRVRLPKNIANRLDIRHIVFETNNLDDILSIAKYRIINFPTSLIIDNRGRVLLKVKGPLLTSYVKQFIN